LLYLTARIRGFQAQVVLIGCGLGLGEEERRFEQIVYASECVNTERGKFIYKHESRM
jgi:hypothetical protein